SRLYNQSPTFEVSMHISGRVSCGFAALAVAAATVHVTGAPPDPRRGAVPLFQDEHTKEGRGPFSLTVDSIMRGPKLVGYPPTGLRWSGDSARLYFEWRR